MCGGNITRPHLVEKLAGLSPLVRGKPTIWPGDSLPGGSIPACAGETHRRRGRSARRRVYPRLCGGNDPIFLPHILPQGLSPLVRGKQNPAPRLIGRGGSIPACAGETSRALIFIVLGWVYPRLCGGNACSSVPRRIAEGLSPLVRGKLPRNGFFRIF